MTIHSTTIRPPAQARIGTTTSGCVCRSVCVCIFFYLRVLVLFVCAVVCVHDFLCACERMCVCVCEAVCVCEWSKLVSVLASGVLYPLDSSPPPRLSQSGTGGVPVWPLETPGLTSSYTTRRLLAGGTAISNANKHGRH